MMRTFLLFAIVILMNTFVLESTAAAQTLPAPQAVTDPKQIKSTPNAQVEPKSLTIQQLYMTRQVGRPTWSPDGRYLAYEVKPKTSAAYEIDVYDMLMREVKHITTGTPQDKRNSNPIWSKDGKYIVYTQEQAKGTDSNIFIADVAAATSTWL